MKSTVALLAMLFASPALALAQFGEAGPAQPPAGSRPQSADEQTLRELDRRLLEAATKGDRSFVDGLLTDDAIVTDRNGRVTTKAEALKTFQPLPDLKFALTREDVRVLIHGDAAVLSARTVGTVQAGSQTIKVDERTTDMFARLGGRWRLVAGHTSDIPAERTAAKIDAKIYDLYVGEYQLTPSVILLITNEGGRLMTQAMSQGKPSGPKSELLPSSETTFFTQGQAGETVSSGMTGAGSPTWSSAGAGRRFRSRRSNERPDAYKAGAERGHGSKQISARHTTTQAINPPRLPPPR